MSQSGISQQTFATLVANLLLHCTVCYFQAPCAPLPPKNGVRTSGAETMKCGHLSNFFWGGTLHCFWEEAKPMTCVYLLPRFFCGGGGHYTASTETMKFVHPSPLFFWGDGALHCFCALATYRRHGNTPSRGTPVKREPQLRR